MNTGTIGRTLDQTRGTLHRQIGSAEAAAGVFIEDVVERAPRLLAQTELDDGLAQTVHAAGEAHGFILVGVAAVDAARHVDQRGVGEVDGLGLMEVIRIAVHGERRQPVPLAVALDAVRADGHGNLEFTIGVAAYHTAGGLQKDAVNLELNGV